MFSSEKRLWFMANLCCIAYILTFCAEGVMNKSRRNSLERQMMAIQRDVRDIAAAVQQNEPSKHRLELLANRLKETGLSGQTQDALEVPLATFRLALTFGWFCLVIAAFGQQSRQASSHLVRRAKPSHSDCTVSQT